MKATKKVYTKEQKKQYFESLRNQWKLAKEYAQKEEVQQAFEEAQAMGVEVSSYGFANVQRQLKALNLEGIPYIDTKTFLGWKEAGFKIRKGEKSKITGVTFTKIDREKKKKDDNGNEKTVIDTYSIPSGYNLFHRSQVEALHQLSLLKA